MISVLLAVVMQDVPLPPEVWKERNRPDMLVLAPCDPGKGSAVSHALAGLPTEVAAEIRRGFGPERLADAGDPFNSTDVIDNSLPTRRFVRAYRVRDYWIVWYERGGHVSGLRTVALRRVDNGQGNRSYRMVPGTVFAGDPCTATKAILAGVTSADTSP